MANGQDFISRGNLQIQVINIRNNFPIQNAKVSISSKGEPERVLEQLTTDSSGQTENISLPAPPEEYSLEPGIYQPYSEYDVLVEAEGFKPLNISGTEILAGTQAIQPAALTGDEGGTPPEDPVVIPDHTLFGNYPPKIAEAEVKPVNESGEIVLSRVTERLQTPPPRITMYHTEIILKMWLPAKSTPPGPKVPLLPMYWLSCPLP